jgi:hypothetical protein
MLTPIQLIAGVLLLWSVATFVTAVVATWLDRRLGDTLVDEGMGIEFWCVSAGGGAAVGGLVALSYALELGISPVGWSTMACMFSASCFTVALVGVGKGVLIR